MKASWYYNDCYNTFNSAHNIQNNTACNPLGVIYRDCFEYLGANLYLTVAIDVLYVPFYTGRSYNEIRIYYFNMAWSLSNWTIILTCSLKILPPKRQ